MQRPSVSQYHPAVDRYVSLVPDGRLADLLEDNKARAESFWSAIPFSKTEHRYAADKWTPKELLLHVIDAERVFSYRALTLGRGDTNAAFPNMDENLFAANVDVSDRSMNDIIAEFSAVRMATIFLFRNLTDNQLVAEGKMSGHTITPLGYGYALIGHTLHHINILLDRYLVTAEP